MDELNQKQIKKFSQFLHVNNEPINIKTKDSTIKAIMDEKAKLKPTIFQSLFSKIKFDSNFISFFDLRTKEERGRMAALNEISASKKTIIMAIIQKTIPKIVLIISASLIFKKLNTKLN